jgi:hypothetical protein
VHGLSGIKGQPISDENDYAENKLQELHVGASGLLLTRFLLFLQ